MPPEAARGGYIRRMTVRRHPTILGEAQFTSRFLSNRWELISGDVIGTFVRLPSRHLSQGRTGGAPIEMRPEGWGTVVFFEEGRELGRIVRRSWWGRRWEISGSGFGCDLVSEPRPRRWTMRIGGHPLATISGTPWSYNRLTIRTDVSVPAWALALTWQVVARPWEAAAEPRSLRAVAPPVV